MAEEGFFAVFVPNSPHRPICNSFPEVKEFLNSPVGKTSGTRFRRCVNDDEVASFYNEQENNTPTSSTTIIQPIEPVSPYKKITKAELIPFRLAIEKNNKDKFEELLVQNPRYLINTDIDSATIVHEGFRFNAMHIACRSANPYVVKRLIEMIENGEWLTHVFGTDSCLEERSNNLMNSLVNTPDLVNNNTPLHYACKALQVEIVRLLLRVPGIKKHPKNKYNERPLDLALRATNATDVEKNDIYKNFYGRNYIVDKDTSQLDENTSSLSIRENDTDSDDDYVDALDTLNINDVDEKNLCRIL